MKEQKQKDSKTLSMNIHTTSYYKIGRQKNYNASTQNGITLVALVVTVVILLILSGVTIATLLGDNGIITKANEAAELTKRSTVVSSVQLDILIEEISGRITQAKLEEILSKYGTVEKKDEADTNKITGLKVDGVKNSIPIEEIYAGTLAGEDNPPEVAVTNKISGTVVDSDGNPCNGATVKLIIVSKVLQTTETNERGQFVFYNVPSSSGVYNINVSDNRGKVKTELVSKQENTDVTDVLIKMPPDSENSTSPVLPIL